jgi:mannosyltransferase OCH1-like enzyme
MDTIYYLWGFKPNEQNNINADVIINNSKYIKDEKIITQCMIEPFLDNNIFLNIKEIYKIIPHWVIKTDLGRLLTIYFNGGLYSDSDCFITKELNNDANFHNVILFTEYKIDSVNYLGPRECKNTENVLRIANFCFGSKTIKHPFFKEVIEECIKRLKQLFITERKINLDNQDILWVCGPDVITTIYHQSKDKYNDIYLYDNSFLNHACAGSWR